MWAKEGWLCPESLTAWGCKSREELSWPAAYRDGLGTIFFDGSGLGYHPLRHMFDTLATALGNAYKGIVGQKKLTEANVDDGIRAVRQALLEADVNFQVAKEFVADVRERVVVQQPGAELHQVEPKVPPHQVEHLLVQKL